MSINMRCLTLSQQPPEGQPAADFQMRNTHQPPDCTGASLAADGDECGPLGLNPHREPDAIEPVGEHSQCARRRGIVVFTLAFIAGILPVSRPDTNL